MANMSYCRFENTLADLRDCEDALNEDGVDSLSGTEKEAAIRLIRMCKRIGDGFEGDIE